MNAAATISLLTILTFTGFFLGLGIELQRTKSQCLNSIEQSIDINKLDIELIEKKKAACHLLYKD